MKKSHLELRCAGRVVLSLENVLPMLHNIHSERLALVHLAVQITFTIRQNPCLCAQMTCY